MPWTPVLMNPETEDRWQDDPAFAAKVYAARAAQEARHVVHLSAITSDGQKIACNAHTEFEAWLALLDFMKAIPDSPGFRSSFIEAWQEDIRKRCITDRNMEVDAWQLLWSVLQKTYSIGKPLHSWYIVEGYT